MTSESGDDYVVLSRTGESVTHGHGTWVMYWAVSKSELVPAHPRCQACNGTGVMTLFSCGRTSDNVCTCTWGRSYERFHHNTLKTVRLDRFEVVEWNETHGREHFGAVLARYVSTEEAELCAAKLRKEDRFQPGCHMAYFTYSVGVRVREMPLPEWA